MNTLPPGRTLVVSLSGTERSDWKLMAAGALLVAFGTGCALGYVVNMPKVERANRVRATRRRMRELERR